MVKLGHGMHTPILPIGDGQHVAGRDNQLSPQCGPSDMLAAHKCWFCLPLPSPRPADATMARPSPSTMTQGIPIFRDNNGHGTDLRWHISHRSPTLLSTSPTAFCAILAGDRPAICRPLCMFMPSMRAGTILNMQKLNTWTRRLGPPRARCAGQPTKTHHRAKNC